MLSRILALALGFVCLAPAADVYTRAIATLGGHPVAPDQFEQTVGGFSNYLKSIGVKTVDAAELVRPNHPEVAARIGFSTFLPPRAWWPRGAALALMADHIAELTGQRISIRNWWRPQAYNLDPVVAGAKNGDHPTANAIDIDYLSREARCKAEKWLRSLDRAQSWLGMSLGLGDRTTHVGIGSDRGRREWHYASWRQS